MFCQDSLLLSIGDPELAPASDCKVGECILFDGNVDRFLVEDSNPPKIDRDWD